MSKKLIILEILGALVMALLVTVLFVLIAATVGGNFMTDFTFMGQRGYEATGIIGIILGLPVGGMLGSYAVRRRFGPGQQETSQAILIGLLVGTALLSVNFAFQLQEMDESFQFYAGKTQIESMYPEFKNLDCFAGCSYEYDKEGDDYYFAYIVHGSGIPIVKATCFKVDNKSQVVKVGEFPDPTDYYKGYRNVDPKNCKGIQ